METLDKLYSEIEEIRRLADIDTFEQSEFADCDFYERAGDWMRDVDANLTDGMAAEGKKLVRDWKECYV